MHQSRLERWCNETISCRHRGKKYEKARGKTRMCRLGLVVGSVAESKLHGLPLRTSTRRLECDKRASYDLAPMLRHGDAVVRYIGFSMLFPILVQLVRRRSWVEVAGLAMARSTSSARTNTVIITSRCSMVIDQLDLTRELGVAGGSEIHLAAGQ
jgi:hypothetical protein